MYVNHLICCFSPDLEATLFAQQSAINRRMLCNLKFIFYFLCREILNPSYLLILENWQEIKL